MTHEQFICIFPNEDSQSARIVPEPFSIIQSIDSIRLNSILPLSSKQGSDFSDKLPAVFVRNTPIILPDLT